MAKVDVIMPKMGESITEGTVIVWHKQPGDTVEMDETILEIGTDKVDTEVPSPAAGVLTSILVAEGDTVDVGTLIATLETDVDAAVVENGSPKADSGAGEESAEPEAKPAEEPAQAPAATATSAAPAALPANAKTVDVVMPKMGESIMEGTILTWHKQPGDAVEMDETLLEIATDKVDTEVPSPAEGVLHSIEIAEGETVEVGTVIARIATGEGAAAAPSPTPSEPESKATTQVEAPAASGDGAAGAPAVARSTGPIPRQGSSGQFYSPLVRSIAEEEGVSLDELETIGGSGRDGRVTKADLMGYIENRGSAPAQETAAPKKAASSSAPTSQVTTSSDGGRVEIIKMDRMRQIIAHHMTESKKTSAHVTSFAEADVTNLVKLREKNKAMFLEREGIKLTYTPFFVHAAVDALREHPVMNASVDGDNIIIKKDYHVGIAVAIDKTGLVVPVIKDAGHKNIAGLAKSASELANRARSKQLQPDDLQGGTITVTNIGSLGSIMGTPIIAQPQVAIMATGAIKKRPVVIEDPELGDVICIRSMMYVSLSYDHRIIDGAMAASFLHHFVTGIESYSVDMEV